MAVWEFRHNNDEEVLSAWAKHFRNHYCLDCDIDFMRGKKSRKDYLNSTKLPCKTSKLGPPIRAGDFGEILVADYLQWILQFWVPRVRWASKIVKDDSPKGSDIIGFYFNDPGKLSNMDILSVFEAKACFSSKSNKARLQDAINDSAKDRLRIDESLNYIKQILYARGEKHDALKVERFQNPVDLPYRELFGAAALFSTDLFDVTEISRTDTTRVPKSKKSKETYPHPNRDHLVLLIIKGDNMMDLVHELYRRAADEA